MAGHINIWDVRWSGIALNERQRPGSGVVTADVSESGILKAKSSRWWGDAEDDVAAAPGGYEDQHPIFWPINTSPWTSARSQSSTPNTNGPSQIIDVGGKKIKQVLFHPTKNVMIVQNSESNLTFM